MDGPTEYINRHRYEQEDPEKVIAAVERLQESWATVKDLASFDPVERKGGLVRVEKDPYVVEYTFRFITDEEVNEIKENLHRMDRGYVPNLLCVLTSFELSRKDTGTRITRADLLPDTCKIFFSPVNLSLKIGGYASKDFIVVNYRPDSVYAFLVLFHEAGHVQNRDVLYADNGKEPEWDKLHHDTVLATVLKSERGAEAFALKKIKPFFQPVPNEGHTISKGDVVIATRHASLQEYHNWIESRRTHNAAMSRYARDMYGDSDDESY